jgi:hypothetical protein
MQEIPVEETVAPTDAVVANGFVETPVEAAPAGLNKQDIQQMVSQEMAQSLVAMLPALLPELLKGMSISNPMGGPSTAVQIGLMNDVAVKPSYLKHYRRDDTVSGKYQLIDVNKLEDPNSAELPINFVTDHNNHTRSDCPAIVKGKWIHFVNGHFYATTEQEVACIEWMQRTQPQFRVYEDTGAGIISCPVVGCTAPGFVDQVTLNGHLKATHGVDHA